MPDTRPDMRLAEQNWAANQTPRTENTSAAAMPQVPVQKPLIAAAIICIIQELVFENVRISSSSILVPYYGGTKTNNKQLSRDLSREQPSTPGFQPLCPKGVPTRGYAAIDFARNQKLDQSFFGRAGNRNLPEVCWNTRSTGDTRTWNTCSRSVGLSPSTAEMFEMQEAPSRSKSSQDGGCDRRSSISAGANRVPLQPR